MNRDSLLVVVMACGAFWLALYVVGGWQVVLGVMFACFALVLVGAAVEMAKEER